MYSGRHRWGVIILTAATQTELGPMVWKGDIVISVAQSSFFIAQLSQN